MILFGNVCFASHMKAACFIEMSEVQAESEGGRHSDTQISKHKLREAYVGH